MIRKKLTDFNVVNNINSAVTATSIVSNGSNNSNINNSPLNCVSKIETNTDANDLPPPPSPPTNQINNNHNIQEQNNALSMYNHSQQQHQVTITQNLMSKIKLSERVATTDATDFDMPLPPPPSELQDFMNNNNSTNSVSTHNQQQQNNSSHTNNNNNLLPPPPPLPPLVESDTASSSSSISINNLPVENSNSSHMNTKQTPKKDDVKIARNCYLDDINQRRFQLKSSKNNNSNSNSVNGKNLNSSTSVSEGKEINGQDTIQPFVNNSDVAAIIDFIRKYRPHVRDSSDEDEENSDWDD
jgi:hypothetical protein